MRKGVFIPDITVEIFKNATLEAIEEFMTSGQMEYIEIPERPHGEWKPYNKTGIRFQCSVCDGRYANAYHFCPRCGADMQKGGDS